MTMLTPEEEVPILSVTQLTNAIKFSLESGFSNVWLQGEISNCKLHTSGHLYFSLKDANAQISAVMYRNDAATLQTLPKDGTQVLVRGEINVYPPSGKYQILVRKLKLIGVGELLLKLEELKIKINRKGWFKKEHKKPLPKMPKRIGVVTSPTGAAIQDILNVLTRRFSGVHVILNPVKVQGEGAAKEIAQAIRFFNDHNLADVLIVGRGGGSIEDLWAFNEEIVAEAIFESRIPIISAVGHETDHCIADYVADVRAPTPSAAAELVIAEKEQQLIHLKQIEKRLTQHLQNQINQYKSRLEGIKRVPFIKSPYSLLGPWMQKLDQSRDDIDTFIHHFIDRKKLLLDSRARALHGLKPTTQIAHFKQRLVSLDRQLHTDCKRILQYKRDRLQRVEETLKALDPKNVLSKGYSILFSENERSVITSVQTVKVDQQVRVVLADGELAATINRVTPGGKA